jgi:hypothetical protein
MKKYIFILAGILLTANVCFSQTTQNCDTVNLKTVDDIKNAGPCIITAADYVLSMPLHGNVQLYYDYRSFILVWMEKTPDHTFTLNSKMTAICQEDENLLLFGVYTTCLAKAAVESKDGDFVSEAIKLFVEYISNAENKVKKTSKITKLIDDFDNNKIDKYIN